MDCQEARPRTLNLPAQLARMHSYCTFIALLVVLLWSAIALAKLEKDLPADAPLRIGVLHRPETCTMRSQAGDRLHMHYAGRLLDGTEFDHSRGRDPFEFQLGAGHVIKGWDRGLMDMCIGEKRKLTVPSGLGYGEAGAGAIPSGATLIFEVELIKIERHDDAL
jgi:FK506-binding protein 2